MVGLGRADCGMRPLVLRHESCVIPSLSALNGAKALALLTSDNYNQVIPIIRCHRMRAVISRDQMIPLLLEACPSFLHVLEEHRQYYGEEIPYVVLGDFARHLLQLHQQHQTEDFPAIAQVIERLHVEGDQYVREAATVGLLEGIQNVWGNEGAAPELFVRYLLPESAKWWQSLNDFWSGKSKFIGEGL
jgi:hypothetical protein